ncbi:unnamed protein product [Dicrocoelium dendriticum]|nr:unnamed protein product [Dicrocoelium dendriticum]
MAEFRCANMYPPNLFVFILFLKYAMTMNADYWGEEFTKSYVVQDISIQHHRLGRLYLRGFPRGSWGTKLFPLGASIIEDGSRNYSLVHILESAYDENESVGRSYANFREKIKNLFCAGWVCCVPRATNIHCEQEPPAAKSVRQTLIDPVQGMPTIFLYLWCTKAWESYHTKTNSDTTALLAKIQATCPNTCIGNPCRRLENTKNTEYCEVTGPFENEYKCDCNENSEWDSDKLLCRPTAICNNEQIRPCHPENTIRCVTVDDYEVKCICKAEFMGADCSLPRDACTERLNKSQATGNQNCRVSFGNLCTGKLGTDQYNCTCKYGYEPLLTMSEDNCLARRDPCQTYFGIESLNKHSIDLDRVFDLENETEMTYELLATKQRSALITHRGLMCLNGGLCVTSADFTRATCVCPTSADGSPLYLGSNCEIPVGTWSAWSSMSSCIPRDCGHTRYRWRRRRCLNVTTSEELVDAGSRVKEEIIRVQASYSPPVRCFGTSEEVIPCDPLDPCTILRLPGYLRTEILDYTTLYHFGLITLVYILTSGWPSETCDLVIWNAVQSC